MESCSDSGLNLIRHDPVPTRRLMLMAIAVFVVSSTVEVRSSDLPQPAAPIVAKWVPRRLVFLYPGCPAVGGSMCQSLRDEMSLTLRQLGARSLVITGTDATCWVLEPVGTEDERAADREIVAAQWVKVTFQSTMLAQYWRTDVLPLFATRNLTQLLGGRKWSVEVLRPVPVSRGDNR